MSMIKLLLSSFVIAVVPAVMEVSVALVNNVTYSFDVTNGRISSSASKMVSVYLYENPS